MAIFSDATSAYGFRHRNVHIFLGVAVAHLAFFDANSIDYNLLVFKIR